MFEIYLLCKVKHERLRVELDFRGQGRQKESIGNSGARICIGSLGKALGGVCQMERWAILSCCQLY